MTGIKGKLDQILSVFHQIEEKPGQQGQIMRVLRSEKYPMKPRDSTNYRDKTLKR